MYISTVGPEVCFYLLVGKAISFLMIREDWKDYNLHVPPTTSFLLGRRYLYVGGRRYM